MLDQDADREAIRLLKQVDSLRKELTALEPQLNEAALSYGRRRGMFLFREFHLRNSLGGRSLKHKDQIDIKEPTT